jgi:hypothetical protein
MHWDTKKLRALWGMIMAHRLQHGVRLSAPIFLIGAF